MPKDKKQKLEKFMRKVSTHGSRQRMCEGPLCDKRDHYVSAHVKDFADSFKNMKKNKQQVIGEGISKQDNKIRIY